MADPLGLLDDLGVPRGLASGDLAALRAWLARKGPRERGPAADAALAASPAGDGAGPDLARVLAVIDLWIDAHGGTIAARAADLPPPAAGAASAFGARFSDALAAALERAWPAEVALGERDAGRLVSLYRRYFLDPYAPHNLARRSGPASPGDLRALVRASLTTPFGAPSGVASGLWAAAAPLSLRTALALWLIAPPEHGLTRAQAARRQAPGRHPRGSGDPRDRPARAARLRRQPVARRRGFRHRGGLRARRPGVGRQRRRVGGRCVAGGRKVLTATRPWARPSAAARRTRAACRRRTGAPRPSRGRPSRARRSRPRPSSRGDRRRSSTRR